MVANLCLEGPEAAPAQEENHRIDKAHVILPVEGLLVHRKGLAQALLNLALAHLALVGLQSRVAPLGELLGNERTMRYVSWPLHKEP